jgi:hypothetical protein
VVRVESELGDQDRDPGRDDDPVRDDSPLEVMPGDHDKHADREDDDYRLALDAVADGREHREKRSESDRRDSRDVGATCLGGFAGHNPVARQR